MTSKQRLQSALSHEQTDKVPVDFGTTGVTGIHCKIVEELRKYYGLKEKPVRVIEPFQMLGEVDDDLHELLGTDVVGVFGSKDLLGIDETQLHEQVTPWGQKVLIAKDIDLTPHEDGNIYVYAEGDKNYPPSAVMPSNCYFINSIERQHPIDDDKLNPEDNLEEFGYISDDDLNFLENTINKLPYNEKGVIASFGGTALGDIALVPGMNLKDPKGIRSVSEWYMSTVVRQDYLHHIFEKQIDIAIENHKKLWDRIGSKVDVIFTCGTDFGTQDSQFCSAETFNELWLPHYKRFNDWVHQNTTWKVFKHSCGAILPILPSLIDAGFDIINPVQINAKGMDTKLLKSEFGDHVTFWGGGIDTQRVLPYGTPDEVKEHVLNQIDILSKNGGFVFNSIHNIQANVPIQNLIAMFDAVKLYNSK